MPPHKRENLWLNLLLNVVLPSLLLSKGGAWFHLPPAPVLLLALSFPIAYGIYDRIAREKVNLFSVIGFVSVLVTGAIGLLKNVPTEWIAVKEAAVPLLFAVAILASAKSKRPLLRSLLYSPEMFDVQLIDASLDARGARDRFEAVIASCQGWVIASFGLSAALNFALARLLVRSPSGTEAFNREIGKMTALSWPVIALPTTLVMLFALVRLTKGIEACTGHVLDDVLHPDLRAKIAAKEPVPPAT